MNTRSYLALFLKGNGPLKFAVCICISSLFNGSNAWAAAVCVKPSPSSIEEGAGLLSTMQKIRSIESLLPVPFQRETGYQLKYLPQMSLNTSEEKTHRLEFFFIKGLPDNYVSSAPMNAKPIGGDYSVAWGYSNGGSVSLRFRLNENNVCVTEGALVKMFGKQFEESYSTLRHYSLGQVPIQGIRPQSYTMSFASKHGRTMTYQFDCTCASDISVIENHGAGWYPRLDQLGVLE